MDHFDTAPVTSNVDARRLLRRIFLLALIPAVILAGKLAHSADGQDWTIDIQPQPALKFAALQVDEAAEPLGAQENDPFAPAASDEAAPAPVEITEPAIEEHGVAIVPMAKFRIRGLTYRQVYDSIPFSRSEYLANPAYRHDATMELLTGIPRQSIHASYEARLNEPIPPQPEFLYNRYGTFGGTFDGGYGGGFGYGGFNFYRPQYAPAFRYFLPIEYGL